MENLCWYCGKGPSNSILMTIDHIIPVSKGGTNNPSNLRDACHLCNATKGARSVEEFRHLMARKNLGVERFSIAQKEFLSKGFGINIDDLIKKLIEDNLIKFHGEDFIQLPSEQIFKIKEWKKRMGIYI